MKKRIVWIDLVRGFGMLMIICGHSLANPNGKIGSIIYAVNVPIFFVLSGYLYRPQKVKKQCKKLFFNLLVPYIGTSLIILLISIILNLTGPFEYIKSYGSLGTVLSAGFFGMGSSVHLIGTQYVMTAIGAIWFLFALFWDSIFFNVLMKSLVRVKGSFILVGAISTIIMAFGFVSVVPGYLPWSINAAFIGLFFMWIGQLFRRINLLSQNRIEKLILVIIGSYLWILSELTNTHFGLNIAISNKPLISILSACGASLVIIIVFDSVERVFNGRVLSYLSLYGKYSLAVLSMHIIDVDLFTFSAQIVAKFPLREATVIIIIIHVIISIIGIVLFRSIPIIRSMFFNREWPFKFQINRGLYDYKR